MGWFFRKSFRLLPGIRVNLSKSGPRVSVGVPGARASMDIHGKARVYAGKGPLRYQKAVTLGSSVKKSVTANKFLLAVVKRVFGRP